MSAALRFSKTTPADSPERVSGRPFRRSKAKRPAFGGPFVFDTKPISWPVRQERAQAQEPVRAPGPVLQGLVPPGRAQPELVRPASSVLPVPVPARAPVCWPPVARQGPDAHRFFQKHNTRQPPE